MKDKDKAKIGMPESIRRIKRLILKETGLNEDELVAAESKGRNRRRFNAIWSPATGNLRTYFGELVIASKLVTIAGPAPKTSASDRKFNFYSATG